jgi:RNA polymerase sigma-70 factor (ECF subfamily)
MSWPRSTGAGGTAATVERSRRTAPATGDPRQGADQQGADQRADKQGDEWPDEQVVARVLAGERALYEVLMRRHNQRLFRVVRGVLRDDDEAADVMQEAYVRAYRGLAGFRHEASFVSWVTRIALHEAFARQRRARRLRPLTGDGGDDGHGNARDGAPDPERAAGNRELREALRREVERLPEGLRAVFVLREVEELSTREAAHALDISEENVKVRLHRAKALLRERLDDQLGREARQLYLFAGRACDAVVAAVMARLDLPA